MSAWKSYRSHKIVKAAPIDGRNTFGDLLVEGVIFKPNVPAMKDKAIPGDYAVEYDDGYKSISPKEPFENGYTEIT